MKLILIVIACLAPTLHANACRSLENLSWLLGEWQSFSQQQDILESWKQTSDVTFEGVATTKSKNDFSTISNEAMRIVEMSGEIFYIAKVKHNPLPIAFKLTKCSNTRVSFENQNHDFPKKINYTLKNTDKIKAHVTDNNGKNFTLYFTRNIKP